MSRLRIALPKLKVGMLCYNIPTPKILMSGVVSTGWSYNVQKKESVQKEVPLKELKEGDVRIKVSHFAVITTDMFAHQPCEEAFLGSQAFGQVAQVGPTEGRFKVGDRVAVGMYRSACGNCRECYKDRDDLCRKAEYTSGSTIGGYSTYIDASSNWIYQVPSSIPDEVVPALVSDGSAIYSALKRHASDLKGTVGIIGSKAMGQLAFSFAKAMKYDATVLGDAEDKSAIEALGGKFQEKSSNKASFNVVLICTPIVDSDCYNHAMKTAKLGGKVVVIGHPVQGDIRFGFFDLVGSELELVQNLVGSRQETHEALYLAATHNIRPAVKLHKFEEVPKLFEQLDKHCCSAYEVVRI